MSARSALLLAAALLPLAAAEPPPATEAEIRKAVAEMGDGDFNVRERASERLFGAGRAAEPFLREAAQGTDPEVVWRAEAILEKFRLGVYPDTPPDIAALAKAWREQTLPAERGAIVGRLLLKGDAARPVLVRLALAEKDPGQRQAILRALLRISANLPAILVAEGEPEAAADLLLLAAAGPNDAAARDLAALLSVRGGLDERIREIEGSPVPESRRAATWLHRARGNLAAALKTAEETDGDALRFGLLLEAGRHADAAAAAADPESARDPLEGHALLAALHALAGDAAKADFSIERLRAAGARRPRGDADARYAAEALFLNRRPEDALAILREKDPEAAFDLLFAMFRFEEAFEAVKNFRPPGPEEAFLLDLRVALARAELGQNDQARAILDRLRRGLEKAPSALYAPLIAVEVELGLEELALADAARALSSADPAVRKGAAATAAPGGRGAAEAWWKLLRAKAPEEEPAALLRKTRDLVGGRVPREEAAALAKEARGLVRGLSTRENRRFLEGIGEGLAAASAFDEARGFFLEAGEKEAEPILRAGELLAAAGRAEEAASMWALARERNPRSGAAAFLEGRALLSAGREREGEARMALAPGLPLGSSSARLALAREMARAGMRREAREEWARIPRTDAFATWETREAAAALAASAETPEELREAARLSDLALFYYLHKYHGGPPSSALLHEPWRAPLLRAIAALREGKKDEALEELEAAKGMPPGDVETPVRAVRALAAAGLEKEAEALLASVLEPCERALKVHPGSPRLHNAVAWRLARAGRRLDEAVSHAERAVALAPRSAGWRDTLAEALFQKGEKERAAAAMKECIALEPDREYFRGQLARFQAGDRAAPLPEE